MLKKKIQSISGATILIALLFFLLCAMVGSVVLAAGTAASGRIVGLEENQQSYYSVTSAARILRDEIEDQKFEYYKNTINGSDSFVYLVEPEGALKDVLKKGAEEIFGGATTYKDTLSIFPSDTLYKKSIRTVSGDFTMKSDYSIVIELKITDVGSEQKYHCRITVPALLSRDKLESSGIMPGSGEPYTRVETALLWRGAVIEKS